MISGKLRAWTKARRATWGVHDASRVSTRRAYSIACLVAIGTVATTAATYAQKQTPVQKQTSPEQSEVTAYVIMTPNGPATCATWVQWRAPGADPTDKESIQFWAEGYISGLAAGSRHDVLGAFRLQDLGAWLDRYCAANPQTKLPLALNALGREMLAHPGGQL